MSDVPLADRDLAALVPEWLEWSEVAGLLGVTPSKVRTMIREHELAQAVSAPGAGPRVPADFIQDGLVVKGLLGTADAAPRPQVRRPRVHRVALHRRRPPGRPIDALRENRGSEVKRRAQVLEY